jgi:hypothetical protein
MNDFDRLVIEEMIRARVGRISQIDLDSRGSRTPMRVLLETAERSLDTSVDLFWIDEGIPGHFCLLDEGTSAVVFHTRALRLGAQIRELYVAAPIEPFRTELAEKLALQRIAELLLQRGHIDQSLQTLARASTCSGISILEPDVASLESWPLNERYIATWFFGFAHELGHALAPRVRSLLTDTQSLSSSHVAEVLEGAINKRRFGDDSKMIVRAILAKEGKDGWCSVPVIQEEATADLFAFLILREGAEALLGNGRVDTRSLAREALIAFNSLIVMDQCRVLASWFDDVEAEQEHQNLTLSNVAMQVRQNLLIRAILRAEDQEALCSICPALRTDAIEPEWLAAAVQDLGARSATVGDGLFRARKFLSSKEMRDPSLFYRYARTVATDAALGLEAARFARLASVLGRTSHELDVLAQAARA